MHIDLNADLGEGAGFDRELMPLITSANICCGLHAGGPSEIAATLDLALAHGVAIGAHPGYADRANFGRVEQDLSSAQLTELVQSQLASLEVQAREKGGRIAYVKPHGALYNQACRDRRIADCIVVGSEALGVAVVGLPGSQLEKACGRRLPFIPEGFADRRYRPDGSLTPRTEANAMLHDPEEAVKQVEWLVRERGVRTICIHGDNSEAVAFARAVRAALLEKGLELGAFA
jgi:UPF0271 protein